MGATSLAVEATGPGAPPGVLNVLVHPVGKCRLWPAAQKSTPEATRCRRSGVAGRAGRATGNGKEARGPRPLAGTRALTVPGAAGPSVRDVHVGGGAECPGAAATGDRARRGERSHDRDAGYGQRRGGRLEPGRGREPETSAWIYGFQQREIHGECMGTLAYLCVTAELRPRPQDPRTRPSSEIIFTEVIKAK